MAGWIEEIYLRPQFHFTFFPWVRPLPPLGMHVAFAFLAASGLALCLGFRARVSAALYCLVFTYVELIEKAAYLNHYYFVSLMTFLLSFIDSGGTWSMDDLRRRRKKSRAGEGGAAGLPALALWVLRLQVGVVYFFAGLAKLNADWLLSGQPLRTWLAAFAHLPLIGGLMSEPLFAVIMSWFGAAFDLTAPFGLGFRTTRKYYFSAVVAFHTITWLLFPIGIFPWVMIAAATLFFSPAWPLQIRDRVLRRASTTPPRPGVLTMSRVWSRPRRLVWGSAALVYCAFQIAVPLRFLAYPGAVNWTERGFRFAWRVMLVEKAGLVEYRIVRRGVDGIERESRVSPRTLLSPLQYRMMRTQPDMIAQFGQELAEQSALRGGATSGGQVQVFADAWVSHNGRRGARLVCPDVDLSLGVPADDRWLSKKSGRNCVSLPASSR